MPLSTDACLPTGDDIVITGIAGSFPESENVYQFQDNLFNKVDMVTEDDRRWKLDHPDVPARTGKLYNIDKFDASFFSVHYKQAEFMDPQCRMLLEKTYEAIVDAGVNPRLLRGQNTGVFIGAYFSESENDFYYEKLQNDGLSLLGCCLNVFSNRLSYWLGTTGPSYTLETACSSSMYAIEHAYRAMRGGLCDSAIVGGSNLCLHPCLSRDTFRFGALSRQGICRSFDRDADGYARSEAVCVVFLQKARDAKRVYAKLVHAKTNCDGYKEEGFTFPSRLLQTQLMEQFYEECCVNPASVDFIEAHATGTKVGDPEELAALDQVYCKGRQTPLLIGSVKSNMGHSEAAAGLCSITKVVTAMEHGLIPPNLHFSNPREDVEGLRTGRFKVVTEKHPWNGCLAGVNSFGMGGANAHILLQRNEKQKVNGGAPVDTIPRLVVASGRTEEAVDVILNDASHAVYYR